MEQENHTNRIVDYVCSASFEDIDETAIARAKERLIDSLGVLSIGRTVPDADSTVHMLAKSGGTEESTVATYGVKMPMGTAAFANSVLMRSYDFEPIDAEAVIEGESATAAHISGTTIPVVLAVGEYLKCSGKDLLRALIIADDVAARALNASGFSVHDYFDGNGTGNVLGAVTAAGLLFGLSRDDLKGAYSLAVNQMGGTMQNVFEKKITFKVPIALAARAGIFAAQLVQCGYGTCLDDPIAGPRGYFDLFYSQPTPEKMLHNLGKKFHADCAIKPWPACRATHGSIDATLEALQGKTFKASEVERVMIHVPEKVRTFVGVGFEFGMKQSYQGAFSIDFLVATAILRGGVLPAYFSEEYMLDPNLGELLEKIEIAGDLPASGGTNAASAEIHLADGTTLSHQVEIAKGDYYLTRFTRDDILRKYYANIDFGGAISRDRADKIVSLIDELEHVEDVSALMELLA